MRVTGVFSAIGAVIVAVMFANLLIHPDGTKAAGKALVDIEKPTLNAMLGQTS